MPHKATSQTAHTTTATESRSTLSDTEPEKKRQRPNRKKETHREHVSAFNRTLQLLKCLYTI